MVKLPPDFKEFLSLLHTHRVKYLLVGGYAVAAHGYPRFTGDMDVWIQTNTENVGRLKDLADLENLPESLND